MGELCALSPCNFGTDRSAVMLCSGWEGIKIPWLAKCNGRPRLLRRISNYRTTHIEHISPTEPQLLKRSLWRVVVPNLTSLRLTIWAYTWSAEFHPLLTLCRGWTRSKCDRFASVPIARFRSVLCIPMWLRTNAKSMSVYRPRWNCVYDLPVYIHRVS